MGRKAVVQKVPEKVFPKEPPPETVDELDELEADADAGDSDDTLIGDNIGEPSVEINVEGLIAELEAEHQGHAEDQPRKNIDALVKSLLQAILEQGPTHGTSPGWMRYTQLKSANQMGASTAV